MDVPGVFGPDFAPLTVRIRTSLDIVSLSPRGAPGPGAPGNLAQTAETQTSHLLPHSKTTVTTEHGQEMTTLKPDN